MNQHLPANQTNTEHSNDHLLHPWEKSCHALIDILEHKNLIIFEEKIKKWLESSPDGIIDKHAYYEHWILTAMQILIEKGLLQHEEVSKKIHEIALRSVQETRTLVKT